MRARDIGTVTFAGQAVDDPDVLRVLPPDLAALLWDTNGFVLFHGGLHVRGAVRSPAWHSLRAAMEGPGALVNLYATVHSADIPFAQDCFGDQFLLRNGAVVCLRAETGDVEPFSDNLTAFWSAVRDNPEQVLNFDSELRLNPGELLHAYPPFCTKESKAGVSLKAVPARELILFHADFAKQIGALPPGQPFKVVVK